MSSSIEGDGQKPAIPRSSAENVTRSAGNSSISCDAVAIGPLVVADFELLELRRWADWCENPHLEPVTIERGVVALIRHAVDELLARRALPRRGIPPAGSFRK